MYYFWYCYTYFMSWLQVKIVCLMWVSLLNDCYKRLLGGICSLVWISEAWEGNLFYYFACNNSILGVGVTSDVGYWYRNTMNMMILLVIFLVWFPMCIPFPKSCILGKLENYCLLEAWVPFESYFVEVMCCCGGFMFLL